MNKLTIVLIAFVALVLGAAFVLVGSYVSANNYGANMEARIEAKYEDCQNVLAQYGQKVQEAVQVPEMYRDDFKEVIKADMEGRYGSDGSGATFQWIQERNLNFDSELYKKLQTIIEAGRNEFKNAQTGLLDLKRQYKAAQNYVWKGMWMRIAGYPKINLDDFQIVKAERAVKAFETGVEEPMKLREEK